MSATADQKAQMRKAAFVRRKEAHERDDGAMTAAGAARLATLLAPYRGRVLSGYMPIRTEMSPLSVMAQMANSGPVCVPVIQGHGQRLQFQLWTLATEMVAGPFGAMVPARGDVIEPEVLIVPLVAFDRQGRRLGYGGGFYDRTLEALRARGGAMAVGFAYGAQEAEVLPHESTDQPLDAIVTEGETLLFG